MKEKIKIILKWLGISAGIILLIGLIVLAIIKDENKPCERVLTKVDFESGNNFISEFEIDSVIQKKFSNQLVGMKIRDIKMNEIEFEIKKNKYVREVQMYSTFNKDIIIQVTQKEALVRIINNTGVSYYLTNIGDTIPLSSKFTSRVLVVQGDIQKSDIPNVLVLSNYINGDNFWKATIEGVYKGSNGDYELYTKLGNQNVVFGKIDDDLENKFKKLKTIYTELLPKVDFNKYKTINLKFKGQVVCSKI
ncbi:MAG: hypothetical protein WCP57_12195 [Bacteroidota bacterium]